MSLSDGVIQGNFVVPNELGLHARAATRLAKTTNRFSVELVVTCGKRAANAKSVLDLLTLGAEQGQTLSITAKGPEANAAMDAIAMLFSNNLGD